MSYRRLIITRTIVATCPDDRYLSPIVERALTMHGPIPDRRRSESYSFDNGEVQVTIADNFINEYSIEETPQQGEA